MKTLKLEILLPDVIAQSVIDSRKIADEGKMPFPPDPLNIQLDFQMPVSQLYSPELLSQIFGAYARQQTILNLIKQQQNEEKDTKVHKTQ